MTCQVARGLLALRACGEPAFGACEGCGRAVCAIHGAGGRCPSCAGSESESEGETDSDYADEESRRESYYSTYGTPSEFGDSGYFSGADRASLGQRFPGMAAGPVEAGDNDGYDALET